MRTEDLYSSAVPMVVKLDIGMTEPEGVALEITYAQTRERFEAGQFDRAMYVMTIPMANELLSILQTEMKIDDQLIFGRRLHRQIGWLLALEDAIDVAGGSPVLVADIRPVGDQAATGDEEAIRVD